MKIIVCVKHARFVYAQTGSDPTQNLIGPDDTLRILNPLDESALEQALRIKDGWGETEVIAVSLGDRSAEDGLRRTLAMGADRAIHLAYETYEELDSWATATALAHVAKNQDFQLILCGQEAIDNHNGLVGPFVAEVLGIPHLSGVVHLDILEGGATARVHRAVERGNREIMECSLPALFTIDRRAGAPRYPTVPGRLKAEAATIERIDLQDLELQGGRFGPALNMTEIVRVSRPKPRIRDQKQTDGRISASERLKLMMKGGEAKEKTQSKLLEGSSDNVLDEIERLMRECGVELERTGSG
jgi:electron transfer flavoprotein beta subunit